MYFDSVSTREAVAVITRASGEVERQPITVTKRHGRDRESTSFVPPVTLGVGDSFSIEYADV